MKYKMYFLAGCIVSVLLSCTGKAYKSPYVHSSDSIAKYDTKISVSGATIDDKPTDSVLGFKVTHNFQQFPAQVYKGNVAEPCFKGNPYSNDPEYVEFITEGCKEGINFGGRYTLIERSCGAMCSHLFMVDRSNGKIFTGTLGLKETDGYYGFKYSKDSYLLIVNATALTDKENVFNIIPEVFVWKNGGFKQLE